MSRALIHCRTALRSRLLANQCDTNSALLHRATSPIRETPPYFIPLPFALGLSAHSYQMRSPTETGAHCSTGCGRALPDSCRRSALLVGLRSTTSVSTLDPKPRQGGTSVGSSVYICVVAKLSLGEALNMVITCA